MSGAESATSKNGMPAPGEGPRRRRRPRGARRNGLDRIEVATVVCKYLCEGKLAKEIADLMSEHHGIKMSREEPYQHVAFAARQGWLNFRAPQEEVLRDKLKAKYPWLHDVRVVHTSAFDHVANRGAEVLMDMVRRCQKPVHSDRAVHVGVAGGYSMFKTVGSFSKELKECAEGLPPKLVFHAMASGFHLHAPQTDPNALMTCLVDSAIPVEIELVGLHVPALVQSKQIPELRGMPGVQEGFDRAKEIDIIVTSATRWEDKCSMMRRSMGASPSSMEVLETEETEGDLLWRPIGKRGPITTPTEIRAMTVMELSDFPALIKEGKSVLLVIGACGGCNSPKSDILKVILDLDEHYITHVVTDSRTAAGVV